MPVHLFVYGTLLSASLHPMARRLQAQARLLGNGSVPGLLYDFGAYPCAKFGPELKQRVLGEVFALRAGDPLLAAIDDYEDCANESESQFGLRRIKVAVTLDTGRRFEAWTYGLHQVPRPGRPIMSGDWIAQLAARRPRALRR
jgi:gamma-glutamylcyclotransferase (GGCT)/AIG2-like uncharacterized protein YtfP